MTFTVRKDVMVPMRNGVELATDLWVPDDSPAPTLQWASVTASGQVGAIAPTVTTTDYYTAPWYSDGGALSWHAVQSWSTGMAVAEALRQLGRGTGDPQLLAQLGGMMANPQPHLEALPLSHQPLLEKVWPWWAELLSHPSRDQFWQDLSVLDHAEQIAVPALHIGGWFDIFIANTARSFTELKARSGAPEGQRLIIGPWDHLNSTGIYPDRRFGLTADAITQDLTGHHLRFFDRWLRGKTSSASEAPVKIFVMGIDQWREEQDWPLPDTSYVPYYLHSEGRPNTSPATGDSPRKPPARPPRTPTSTTRCDPCPPWAAG